jgi:hypothetical protein
MKNPWYYGLAFWIWLVSTVTLFFIWVGTPMSFFFVILPTLVYIGVVGAILAFIGLIVVFAAVVNRW